MVTRSLPTPFRLSPRRALGLVLFAALAAVTPVAADEPPPNAPTAAPDGGASIVRAAPAPQPIAPGSAPAAQAPAAVPGDAGTAAHAVASTPGDAGTAAHAVASAPEDAGTAAVATAAASGDAGTAAPPSAAAAAQASAAAQAAAESSLEKQLEGIDEESPALQVPSRVTSPPIATAQPMPRDKDLLAQARKQDGRYVVGQGANAQPLTIDPALQEQLVQILKSYRVPYGAVVALDPATGRVLAMAEHSEARPDLRGLAVQALFPAASVFKIVTATALLSQGVKPDEQECFHGGKRRLDKRLLEDSLRDALCYSFSTALAKSANVVFAKLTMKHLSSSKLRAVAEALHFNKPLPFEMPAGVSLAAIPEDPFGLATTGAGFGDVYLSPLHGAALAATVANKGVWREPILLDKDGQAPAEGERVMSEEQALALTDMMEQTITQGTAHRVFRERGHQVKGAVGKTGSLADKNPFRDYSWFVGFAPRDNPKVAVAAVIVNEPLWHIRATWLGREAMRLYLERLERPDKKPVVGRPVH